MGRFPSLPARFDRPSWLRRVRNRGIIVNCWKAINITLRLTIVGLAVTCLVGIGFNKQPAADVIKVGEFASLTAKEANFGNSSHQGTLLAIEELNAAAGVPGKKLELI